MSNRLSKKKNSETSPQNKPISLGLIGYGTSGRFFHAPFIQQVKTLKLTAIASTKKNVILQDFPNIRCYPTPEELIADPEIDIVVIASPNAHHYQQALLALEQGKHVVIDKPFTLSLKETLHLKEVAEENSCLITAYHNRRWDSDFVTLKSVLEQGLLGEVLLLESFFDQYKTVSQKWKENPTEPGSGIIYDIAPHLIDQALQLFGYPETITADAASLRPHSKVTDYFTCTLFYPNKRVILRANHFSSDNSIRWRVHGTKGTLISTGKDPQESLIRETITRIPRDSHEKSSKTILYLPAPASPFALPFVPSSYTKFYELLGLAVYANDPDRVPVPMKDIIQASALLEDIHQAILKK